MLGNLSVAEKSDLLAIYLQAFTADDEGAKYIWEEANNGRVPRSPCGTPVRRKSSYSRCCGWRWHAAT
jgi:hypothetical protein